MTEPTKNNPAASADLPIGDPTLAATLEVRYLKNALSALPREQKWALDIGAHRGEVTAALLADGFRVIAVEPQDFLADRLNERFASEIAAEKLYVERCAASDRTGTAALYVGSASTVSSLEEQWTTVAFPEEFRSPRRIDVPLIPASELLTTHGVSRLGFAKVDVEGHEFPAIKGLLSASTATPPAMLMFEANHCFPERAQACLDYLSSHGYGVFDLFVRWGIDPIAGERFTSAKLPSAWHACGSRNFYANIIAYHGTGPAGIDRLDPAWFVRHYQSLHAQALLRKSAGHHSDDEALADEVLAGGWESFPNHPLSRHFSSHDGARLLDDLRNCDGKLPRRVVEVGGGVGGSARAYLGVEPHAAYTLVDSPQRLAVQHFRLTLTMPHVVVEYAQTPHHRPRPGQILLVPPALAQEIASGPELLFSTAPALQPALRNLVGRTDALGASRVRLGKGPAVARRPWGGALGVEVCGAD